MPRKPNHTVIVGLDGSEDSHRALAWAVDYARITGGNVHAVMGWEVPVGPWVASGASVDTMFASGDDLQADREAAMRDMLAAWLPADLDVKVQSEVVEGDPARVLIDAAKRLHAAVIVVGHRGRGGFAGLLLGSVSAKCASNAKCPVVIVK